MPVVSDIFLVVNRPTLLYSVAYYAITLAYIFVNIILQTVQVDLEPRQATVRGPPNGGGGCDNIPRGRPGACRGGG